MINDPTLPPPPVLEAKARSGQLERLPDERVVLRIGFSNPPLIGGRPAKRVAGVNLRPRSTSFCPRGARQVCFTPMSDKRSVAKMTHSCPAHECYCEAAIACKLPAQTTVPGVAMWSRSLDRRVGSYTIVSDAQ